jgi:ABC-type dipeptide/oligopeptide/nickel transport system ATPase subunit
MRSFRSEIAVRENVPLLVALIGPSGSGKTFSALRLAVGIQRVQPGPIHGISTEGKRMLELADRFTFQHVSFAPPFGSLDYLAAIQHCVHEGARTVIIDNMSHEHEGPGGMLDCAERQIEERIAFKVERRELENADDWKADKERQKLKMSSFIKPKADRSKLIQGILQMPCNIIMCFRAKEKLEPGGGQRGEPKPLGWMPIGGDEFWYEMTARCLLLPQCNGVPTWSSEQQGERFAMRRPAQFSRILADGRQLTEEVGEEMARWAAGNAILDVENTLTLIRDSVSVEALRQVANAQRAQPWQPEQRERIASAIKEKQLELKAPVTPEEKQQ